VYPPLAELIPHRGPAVLLDRVLDFGPPAGRCGVVLSEDCLYYRDGKVDALVGLEMLAQAVSAYVGLSRMQGGGQPRPGYLIGVPRAELHEATLPLGVELVAAVEEIWNEGGVGSFRGVLRHGELPLVEAQLSVFEPPVSGALG
jgi:predicted hotdog family 3-hydroxylacyl-ACP dehydratase